MKTDHSRRTIESNITAMRVMIALVFAVSVGSGLTSSQTIKADGRPCGGFLSSPVGTAAVLRQNGIVLTERI